MCGCVGCLFGRPSPKGTLHLTRSEPVALKATETTPPSSVLRYVRRADGVSHGGASGAELTFPQQRVHFGLPFPPKSHLTRNKGERR